MGSVSAADTRRLLPDVDDEHVSTTHHCVAQVAIQPAQRLFRTSFSSKPPSCGRWKEIFYGVCAEARKIYGWLSEPVREVLQPSC